MNKNWTREETIIAFNVYCKIPFKECSKTHPMIIKYANIIGRSPSALNMKIGNIGRLDPTLKKQGISGLTHGARMEQSIWDEFYKHPEHLAFESERLIALFSKQKIENSANIQLDNLPQGKEREVIIKQRVNQSFFRECVISAYNFHCCISGIGNPELLEACHIVDWAQNTPYRMNPENGLCMNPFFHKAYDKYLIAITPDLDIEISEKLIQNIDQLSFKEYLSNINGKKISIPNKFFPKKELLAIHYQEYKNSI